MSDNKYCKLKIDADFKNLIPPLSADEYLQLEQNLIKDGCRESISIWKNYILDGHNRYEICTRINIPFQTRSIKLHSREEAIAWICANQLGRRNISEATRKYLIGKRYEAEKIIGAPNAIGSNQYAQNAVKAETLPQSFGDGTKQKTAERLGNEYHISYATVNKYAIYAHALDILTKKGPDIVPKIFSGQVKLSHENIVKLSSLPIAEVKNLYKQLSDDTADFPSHSKIQRVIQKSIITKPQTSAIPLSLGSIKDLPAYDPDADISSLALTIPSWISSIGHTRSSANFNIASNNALYKLEKQLMELKEIVEEILTVIRRVQRNG